MKAITGLLLVSFPAITLARTVSFLHCDSNFFCSKNPSRAWLSRRQSAQRLVNFHEESKGQALISVNSSFISTYEQKEHLCSDELYTGFLLDKDALEWRVSCLWTGNGMDVSCAPVPTMYDDVPFAYIPPTKWQKKIKDFRIKIGCSEEKINQTQEISELFICNERCIQAGIGYVPSLIMLLSFSIAFIKNCLI